MLTSHRLIQASLAAFALLCTATTVRAQLTDFGGAVQQADMLYLAGEPEQSYDVLTKRIEAEPDDFEALWRAARAAVVVGIAQQDYRDQNRWFDPAVSLAHQARALRPDDLDALYWEGVAAGRRAMNAGPGYAVELAEVVYDDAHAILAQDSLHAGAHNMLGKLNYEIMSLSRIKRLIARTFMGNEALNDTSWDQAQEHLKRAAELWPDFVLFHFDLAQLYRKRGRREEAVVEYRRALAQPVQHPTDVRLQAQAREALVEWDVGLDSLDTTSAPARSSDAAAATPDSLPTAPESLATAGRS